MTLSFSNKVSTDDLITLVNKNNDNVVMAFKADRTFTNLVYSSADLEDGTYYLYKGGEIAGEQKNGFYTSVSNYTKGTKQAYSSKGSQGGNMTGERPELPNGLEEPEKITPPDGKTLPNGLEPPEENNSGERPELPNGLEPPEDMQQNSGDTTATNAEFVIDGISNQFSGVADYSGEENQAQVVNENNNKISNLLSNSLAIVAIVIGTVVLIAAVIGIVIILKKKK